MGEWSDMFRAYKVAHKYREEWYDIRWRAIIILASVGFIFFINYYLGSKYFFIIEEFQFVLSEKLFYWFMIGTLFGIISIGMIFEGEFLLGLRRISKELKGTKEELLPERKIAERGKGRKR